MVTAAEPFRSGEGVVIVDLHFALTTGAST
jgi:hypothetical protein